MLDEVVLKGHPKGSRIKEYTARIATTGGFWYVSEQGKSFERQVQAALRRLKTRIERLIVIAHGVSWNGEITAAGVEYQAPHYPLRQ